MWRETTSKLKQDLFVFGTKCSLKARLAGIVDQIDKETSRLTESRCAASFRQGLIAAVHAEIEFESFESSKSVLSSFVCDVV